MKEYLMIGEVLKPQGIHGECKIRPYSADPDRFLKWKTLYLEKNHEYIPLRVKPGRVHDGFAYITPEGFTTPEDAEKIRGEKLYISRKDADLPGDGGDLIADLIGCEAVTPDGTVIGTLTDVLQYGTVDTWVFKTGKGTMMVPALLAVFPAVDTEAGRITADPEKLSEVAVFED